MPSQSRSQWDIGRFVSTLNYFGEIPFLGSFRWMQQLLGQSPSAPGVALSIMNKRIIAVSNCSPDLIDTLREKLPVSINLLSEEAILSRCDSANAHNRLYQQPNAISPKLIRLIRTVDSLVVIEPSDLAKLFEDIQDSADKSLDMAENVVESCVFDFSSPSCDLATWGALDDVVMGGVSQGSLFLRDRQAVFAGSVSTDNSGGFSSVRTQNFDPPFNFEGWQGMRLRVKGDGQRYKFILRNSGGWDSPAYIYSFDTVAGTWIDVEVPFEEMVATFRAKSVSDAPSFDPQRVFSFQLMLSKFECDRQLNPNFTPGTFELAVRYMSVYRHRKGVPLVVVGSSDEVERSRQQAILNEAQIGYQIIDLGEADLTEAIVQALI